MRALLRTVGIWVLTRISWSGSRQRLAKSLVRFSHVEADSGWQMLRALDAVPDPRYRAKLFNNALEEVQHAAIFRRLAERYADQPLQLATQERAELFNDRGGMVEFSAWHYVGESDVYRDFLAYARAANDPRVRETFMAIRGDEGEHQALAFDELVRASGSRRRAKVLIRRVRLRRAYDAWMRFSKGLGNIVASMILAVLYLSVGWTFAWGCRRRMAAQAWDQRCKPGPVVDHETRLAWHSSDAGAGNT